MSDEVQKIVDALRCDGFESHCDSCDYYTYEVDGKLSCNSDKVYIDAADLIERMDAELERLKALDRHGRWIEPDEEYTTTACICSNCDWHGHILEDDVMGANYCPNCGADMRGGHIE